MFARVQCSLKAANPKTKRSLAVTGPILLTEIARCELCASAMTLLTGTLSTGRPHTSIAPTPVRRVSASASAKCVDQNTAALLQSSATLYRTAGTYAFTVPAGVFSVSGEVWGWGGGGSNNQTTFGAGGGSAGATLASWLQ